MQKFSEIKYIRPDIGKVKKQFLRLIRQMEKAGDYAEARDAYVAAHNIIDEAETLYSIASVRNTMDMTDEFYIKEIDRLIPAIAGLTGALKRSMKALLTSRWREDFIKEFGPQIIKLAESDYRTATVKNIFLTIKENRVTNGYSKTTACCSCLFRGEECNFYGLLKHMQTPDRTERREAFLAWASMYEKISDKLDRYYDKLTRVRKKTARRAGFPSYIEYVYLARNRFEWNAADAASLRDNIKKYVTPVCQKLYQRQAERIGADRLRFYDEELYFPSGNASLETSGRSMTEAAAEMYAALSPETGEFFSYMQNYELFDLETRPNKQLGGYCTEFIKYDAPFIFSNFNGTSADVDVLTHEAGHAFQLYVSSRAQALSDYISANAEISEIHSMAMEMFTYPWMELFFGPGRPDRLEGADKYRASHLWGAFSILPYAAAVDHFQHEIFSAKKTPSAADRRRIWRELERGYMPWRDYDGHPFLDGGGFWMQKQHIFLYPFYYIEYAMAQICVFQFWQRIKEDRDAAWEDYCALCRAGGSLGYGELLSLVRLRSPFEDGVVKQTSEAVESELYKYFG